MTNLVLNGKAVCCMHKGEFDEAETLLLEALNRSLPWEINITLSQVGFSIQNLPRFLNLFIIEAS
ncbi:hypothetical protein ACS0TY_033432 [Phlomoides rotata]